MSVSNVSMHKIHEQLDLRKSNACTGLNLLLPVMEINLQRWHKWIIVLKKYANMPMKVKSFFFKKTKTKTYGYYTK